LGNSAANLSRTQEVGVGMKGGWMNLCNLGFVAEAEIIAKAAVVGTPRASELEALIAVLYHAPAGAAQKRQWVGGTRFSDSKAMPQRFRKYNK
jgi:hypothetical protein